MLLLGVLKVLERLRGDAAWPPMTTSKIVPTENQNAGQRLIVCYETPAVICINVPYGYCGIGGNWQICLPAGS